MTDWPDVAGPCKDDPKMWDIPVRFTSHAALAAVKERTATAVRICRACPRLTKCETDAHANPPYQQVQAALIWLQKGTPRRLAAWSPKVHGYGICGTNAGYNRHLVDEQAPCQPCLDAHEGRAPAPRQPHPCGTPAAYKRHLRNGETPCEPCTAAKRTESRSQRAYNSQWRREQRAKQQGAA